MVKVIEIVGVAGSGKSTLTKNIKKYNPDWIVKYRVPRKKFFILIARSFIRNIIPVIRYSKYNHLFYNLKLLVHIELLSRSLSIGELDKIVVLDQGLLYEYAFLYGFGLNRAPRKYFDKLFKILECYYLETLCVAVFLNGKDAVFMNRVLKRTSNHRLKNMSSNEIEEFYVLYQNAYKEVKNRLKAAGGVKLIEISVDNLSPKEIYDKFEKKLNGSFNNPR